MVVRVSVWFKYGCYGFRRPHVLSLFIQRCHVSSLVLIFSVWLLEFICGCHNTYDSYIS
jgi:hypothetical protein